MLVACWSREEVKDKLDGTVSGVVAHKIIAKYLKERIRSQPHINLEQDKGFGRNSKAVVARGALWVSAKF